MFAIIFVVASCGDFKNIKPVVNTSHLDYLYEEIEVNDTEMAIIHIYSNYPDYKYIDDEDEGTACVDDAARAAVFYLDNFNFTQDSQCLIKNKRLLEFILYLQAENGFFYNFIWSDYSINEDFKTSVAEPNWWSWRALWTLTESYPYYKDSDPIFANKIKNSVNKLISTIKKQIPNEHKTEKFNGLDIPSWLPNKYASDQASVLLLGLLNYYNQTDDKAIYNYIVLLTKGIIQMQINDINCSYDGAFLSWQNSWHAYGNSQAYALLKSHQILKSNTILEAALKELDYFYPTLLKNNYISSLNVSMENEKIITEDENKYSQIAYNKRPMIYALLEAYNITKDEKYAELAVRTLHSAFGLDQAK